MGLSKRPNGWGCVLIAYIYCERGATVSHSGKRVTVSIMPGKPPPIKKSPAKKAGVKTPEPASKPEPAPAEVPPPAEVTPVETAPAEAPLEDVASPTAEQEVPVATAGETPAAEGEAPGR